MDNKIYVVSHKSPDTDTITASIVYSEYLRQKGIEAEAVKLGKLNNETKFILAKFGFDEPRTVNTLAKGSKVALVDHNEKGQTIANIDELNCVAIVDHHKIANLSSSVPMFIRIEPLAATNSILYKMFKSEGLEISKNIAGLMLSAIISDTLYFRSSTTSDIDKNIAQELNKIVGLENMETYSLEMFEAKSDLGDISIRDLITFDYKNFEIGEKKLGIGVIETTAPKFSIDKKDAIIVDMNNLKKETNLDFIMLSVIDILKEKNTTFVASDYEKKVIKEIFNTETTDNLADLGGILSRKKELIPLLNKYFAS